MMGERRVAQEALSTSSAWSGTFQPDHLLRAIDRVVDLSGLRAHLRPFYSDLGRPSIDPELMVRMLTVGYCFGIRSERRLCDEVHLISPTGGSADSAWTAMCRTTSTFSKNRHGRFRDSDLCASCSRRQSGAASTKGSSGRGLRGRCQPDPRRR